LHELTAHVQRAEGKLVLVGDFRQLPEIEAGGVFGALAVRCPPIELRDNWRQERDWEREALELLRAGDPADVADLNRRARGLMRAAGRLSDEELDVIGAGFAVGDRVVVRTGGRRLRVVNGDRGVVSAVDARAGALQVRLRSGTIVNLDCRFLARTRDGISAVQHAYAVAGHVAQGLTTDRTFVLGTDRWDTWR
jgi:ATP-dependent exoDNAse (exonuclease V) alpha subunit